ncbi:MAG TPA: class I SAM-dependent methyltransferase [Sulfolobales archaeon]|nr:class I SAM-dependent methyltransferase [Sulfolobales archaeon]
MEFLGGSSVSLEDLLLIILLVIIGVFAYILLPMVWGAAYAPSPRAKISVVLRRVIETYYKHRDVVRIIDLGSGFGRVCFEAVKIDNRVVCHGVDIDPLKILWSRIIARIKGIDARTIFTRGNILKIDLEGYDIIYMFLWPEIVLKIEEKILKEVRRGCVVISLEHPLRLLKSEKVDDFYIAFISTRKSKSEEAMHRRSGGSGI